MPQPSLHPDQYLRHRTDLLETPLNSDLVALDAAGGAYFGFNTVATEIWRMLDQPVTVRQICSRLLARYQVDPQVCEAEVQALLADMRREGLLETVDAS